MRFWRSPETYDFYNSENSIRDTKPFFRLLFCHTVLRRVLHLFYISEPVMILDYQMLLKMPPT